MNPPRVGWTDERVEALRKHWADGLSASQTAKRLGGVSRSAVIGKLYRLGVGGRGKPSPPPRKIKVVIAPPLSTPARPPSQVSLPPAPVPQPRASDVARLDEVRRGHCCWPIGEPGRPGFGFCGCATTRTYCAEHAHRAIDHKAKPFNPKGALWAARELAPRRSRSRDRGPWGDAA